MVRLHKLFYIPFIYRVKPSRWDRRRISNLALQGKGKKRSVGWFPASYVKLMEAKKEEADQEAGEEVAAGQ